MFSSSHQVTAGDLLFRWWCLDAALTQRPFFLGSLAYHEALESKKTSCRGLLVIFAIGCGPRDRRGWPCSGGSLGADAASKPGNELNLGVDSLTVLASSAKASLWSHPLESTPSLTGLVFHVRVSVLGHGYGWSF